MQLRAHRIALFRPIENDPGDALVGARVALDLDRLISAVGHCVCLLRLSYRSSPSWGETSACLRGGFARKRGDAQCSDAVAVLLQHGEAETVEGEALPRFGDRARLVNDDACDRRRLVV